MTKLLMFLSQSPHPFNDGLVYDPDTDDTAVKHGGTFSVEDDRYEVLSADPYTSGLIQEVSTDYSQMSRAELEQAARDAGVDNPDDWEEYPTDGSLAAAIEAAGAAPSTQQQTVPPAEPGADEPTPSPEQEGQ